MLPFIILGLVNTYILMNAPSVILRIKPQFIRTKPVPSGDGEYTVYGTTRCGWTIKQLDHMKSKGIQHTFVDCEKEPGKCKMMTAFPVVQDAAGKQTVGYTEV